MSLTQINIEDPQLAIEALENIQEACEKSSDSKLGNKILEIITDAIKEDEDLSKNSDAFFGDDED